MFYILRDMYIVMEYWSGGSLKTALEKNDISLNRKYELCRQISAGLLHLHSEKIIHGDVSLR